MIDNLLIGLNAFADPMVLVGLIAGAFIGYLIGAIPGLGPSLGIALMIPFTYSMDPLVSIVMLVALFAAAEYGGAISGILLNSPGTAAAVATTWDGYPLTKQGKTGIALNISIISSGIGIFVSTILLFFTAVPLSEYALNFGPSAYFALALLGLSLVSSFSSGSMLKGALAMGLGLALATVGLDSQTGVPRFSYHPDFFEGLPLVPVLLGLFALSEVLFMIEAGASHKVKNQPMSGILEVPFKTFYKMKYLFLRSSLIGYFVGVIPGAGASIGSFISYAVAKRFSKQPERFGNGSYEGIAASETANNASVSGSLSPLLALGIPGSATTAIMIGALMIHGVQPGPLLFTTNPEIPYTVFVSLWLSVPIMVFIGLAGARFWAKVADIPRPAIAAIVASISLVGAYASTSSMFPVYVALTFGVVGYVLRKANIPLAPVILALVLGDMLETNLRRALSISNGDVTTLVANPLSATLLAIAALSFLLPALGMFRKKVKGYRAH
ncbi:tripartite tricarboxylate transporter permease [Vreelandella sp. F11]|uniref:tripartite tricarboxylate transporter permease n=1 Tax=Vreelandella sp. F11 TaxID=3394751 RepID=UPI0036DE0EDC